MVYGILAEGGNKDIFRWLFVSLRGPVHYHCTVFDLYFLLFAFASACVYISSCNSISNQPFSVYASLSAYYL